MARETLKADIQSMNNRKKEKCQPICGALRCDTGDVVSWSHEIWFLYASSVGFPCGPADKESACSAGHLGLIPGLGRSSGEGNGYPLQWPGEFHRLYNLRGHKDSNMTE